MNDIPFRHSDSMTPVAFSGGEELERLLTVAVHSLRGENESLAAAFAASKRSGNRKCNRSLAYWVFETTLAYSIFKAWLPIADVDWEYPYPSERAKKADLVVFDSSDTASLIFELKWWMASDLKTTDSIKADVEKLLTWGQPDVRRIILAFWHSPDTEEDWQKDQCEVKQKAQEWGCSLRGTARFPINHTGGPRYFAMSALELIRKP